MSVSDDDVSSCPPHSTVMAVSVLRAARVFLPAYPSDICLYKHCDCVIVCVRLPVGGAGLDRGRGAHRAAAKGGAAGAPCRHPRGSCPRGTQVPTPLRFWRLAAGFYQTSCSSAHCVDCSMCLLLTTSSEDHGSVPLQLQPWGGGTAADTLWPRHRASGGRAWRRQHPPIRCCRSEQP